MATGYIRQRNLHLSRFAEPLSSSGDDNRGLINEMAFRLYAQSRRDDTTVGRLRPDSVVASMEAALHFIRRFREYSRAPIGEPSKAGIREAKSLAVRLERFVQGLRPQRVVVSPAFAGCGWLDECNGDLLLDDMLCEVKSPGGKFRGWDLRQVLVYAALNFQTKAYVIRTVCLVNPRLGLFLKEDLEDLCYELSGTAAADLLGEIVAYVSEPRWTDTGGA